MNRFLTAGKEEYFIRYLTYAYPYCVLLDNQIHAVQTSEDARKLIASGADRLFGQIDPSNVVITYLLEKQEYAIWCGQPNKRAIVRVIVHKNGEPLDHIYSIEDIEL